MSIDCEPYWYVALTVGYIGGFWFAAFLFYMVRKIK